MKAITVRMAVVPEVVLVNGPQDPTALRVMRTTLRPALAAVR